MVYTKNGAKERPGIEYRALTHVSLLKLTQLNTKSCSVTNLKVHAAKHSESPFCRGHTCIYLTSSKPAMRILLLIFVNINDVIIFTDFWQQNIYQYQLT